jgi:phosphotransferase system enzyme I (PtsI)
MTSPPTQVLEGMAISEGVAIGRAICVDTRIQDVFRIPLTEGEEEREVERLAAAVRRARQEMQETRSRVGEELHPELAAIFDAHSLILADPALLERIEARIRRERINAEWAVHRTAAELDDRFARIESAHLSERSEDVKDVSRYILRALQGTGHHDLAQVPGEVIVIAHDLTPSEAVRLGRGQVRGFAVEGGGRTSHTAIIARSLNIPLVGGLHGVTELATDEDLAIVDGSTGRLILHPTPEMLEDYRRRQQQLARRERELLATRDLPAVSRDGVAVELMANVDLPEEIAEARRFGARGIGLYRSEFLYIEKSPDLPTENEHYRLYRHLLEQMAPHPVVIRTFDLGGRKLAREVMETHESNPVLGLRGIRLTLARPHIFRIQVRALLRAGLCGDLGIMLPLVATLEEVRLFRRFLAEVMAELDAEGVAFQPRVRLGTMIEVPSAALIADLLAREVDFFSLGTNDLIQYALAVDRSNEHVSYLYRPLHPAILRMIHGTVEAARGAGIEVSVCGEMAADPACAALLVGLGLRKLSLSPRKVPEVKTQIRELDVAELEKLALECLSCGTADEVQQRVDEVLARRPVDRREAI